MLTDEQEEIISQALVPLFEYLEQEVIRDVAKRISESLAYTRTAELEVEHLQKLGYSPARIRKEAMKILNADAAFRKTVAKNTLDHKREVKKILKQIMKSAARSKKEVLRDAAELAYFNDLKIWKESGNRLTDRSYLPQLVDAISKQTDRMMENLSGTTGFKSMSGFEMLKNLYQRELDKALIKVCSGAFTREQAVIDTIHSLAVSGLRTIDFSSGRTMQLDTAVRLAVRTGAHQLSAKIMDTNMEKTGKNLVYVSKHWGARNTGTGHANHEQWQGKVYYIKPIKDYSAEAKRIGQSKIEDLWEATGYSADGSHESDPLGLNGYNCRHRHYMIDEGSFDPAKHPDDPEPNPVTINGKTYDYYAITQKMRAKEREIRGLKREREALKTLGFDTKEISTKIKRKINGYEDFCEAAGVKADINRLRYEGGTSDLTKTEAWKQYCDTMKTGASDAVRNTFTRVHFNPDYDYTISLAGYPDEVNKGLSEASKKVAELGDKTGYEHMYLVDLESGNLAYYETDEQPTEVGYNYYKILENNPQKKYAFVHNHNTDGMFSETDLHTLMSVEAIPVMIAVRNDAVKYIAERKGKILENAIFDPLYKDEIEELNKRLRDGKITIAERSIEREKLIVHNVLRDYTIGGKLIEQNGQTE